MKEVYVRNLIIVVMLVHLLLIFPIGLILTFTLEDYKIGVNILSFGSIACGCIYAALAPLLVYIRGMCNLKSQVIPAPIATKNNVSIVEVV